MYALCAAGDRPGHPAGVRCSFQRAGADGLVRFVMDLSGGAGGSCAGTLRRSHRSKRVRLIVDERGLTVTVPRSFPYTKNLEPLLKRHLDWILRSLDKVRLRAKSIRDYPVEPPGRIALPALGEEWRVELSDSSRERLSARDGVIRLPGDFNRMEALSALRRWTLRRARETLPPLLLELADEQGLIVKRVAVREMTSRWGSCSTKGNVNLNSRLLFLPPDLVRHVMLHELCHLSEMNHGAAFYQRLHAMDPEAERHIAELRQAWGRVPPWASEPL